MRFTTCFALAGGLVCAGTIMAAAWPATTTGNVNVRSGPGARYSVVNSLPAGVPVDVLSCSGTWCQTQYGYVSSRLIAQNAAAGMTGAQVMPNYAPSAGTNYRQDYNARVGQPAQAYGYPPAAAQIYAPRASTQPGAAYMAPATAPYSTAQPAQGISADGTPRAGQTETMSGARTTIGTANVRSGPGTEYSIVKTLPDFTKVEVQSCANSWCQTDEGYISLYLLSRGPVQQVLSPAAQPRIPGSATRDSSNYYGNVAGQAAMGYGAAGTGQQYAPQAYGAPGLAPRAAGQPMAQAYAPNLAGQAGTNYRANYAAVAGYAPRSAAQPQAYGNATGGTATTTANVNVRGGPGIAYGVVASLPAGAPVNILSCTGSWCQTQYGFVSARHIAQPGMAQPAQAYGYRNTTPNYAPRAVVPAYGYPPAAAQIYAPRASTQPGAAYMAPVTAPYSTAQPAQGIAAAGTPRAGQTETMSGARTTIGTANVRSGPGTEYSIVKTLPDFTKVEVQSCANSWCQTDEGYISLYLLSRGPVQQVLSPAAQPRIPGSATRDSSNYYGNVAGQAAMGYGAAGTGQQYAPQAYGAQNSGTNYRQNFAPTAAGQRALAYAPNLPGQPQVYGAAAGGAAVTTANVNVRGGPGVRYGVVASLPAGTPVSIMSCTGNWCQTQYGYISTRLLSRGGIGTAVQQVQQSVQQVQPVQNYAARSYAPEVAPVARAYAPVQQQRYAAPAQDNYASARSAGYSAVTVSDLNVRSGPGTGYDILNTLPAGTAVEVNSCTGSWCETQFGYVSARHLSTGDADPARVVVRPSRVTGGNYSNAAYVDPAYAGAAYGNAGYSNAGYASQGFVPGPYPADNPLLDIAAAPFVGVAAAVGQAFGGFDDGGYGLGYGNNWTASWGPRYFGPGYWGPGFRGPRRPAYWGARPSYWGGRPTYWNIHPGYRTYANFGDRQGDMYWSRRNEGRRPQAASWYGGRGGVGPYGLAPSYRPLLWQPRAGIY